MKWIILKTSLFLPQKKPYPKPTQRRDSLCAKELSRKKFIEGWESIELACCIERLVDKASPGLPANIRSRKLQYHLINALSEKVSLQLKLLPQDTYQKTVAKARELLLIYGQSTVTEQANQLLSSPSTT